MLIICRQGSFSVSNFTPILPKQWFRSYVGNLRRVKGNLKKNVFPPPPPPNFLVCGWRATFPMGIDRKSIAKQTTGTLNILFLFFERLLLVVIPAPTFLKKFFSLLCGPLWVLGGLSMENISQWTFWRKKYGKDGFFLQGMCWRHKDPPGVKKDPWGGMGVQM